MSAETAVGELRLPADEAARRAARVRLVVSDCDGVLTDAGVYYSARGEELKRFSLRDGMGVELLGRAGVKTAILTRERSGAVARRAEKLKIELLFEGVRDKREHLDTILKTAGVALDEVAYIGDDVNDLEIMAAIGPVGLLAAPRDATRPILAVAHLVTRQPGGHGAFRDFADFIVEQRPPSGRD